MSELLSAIQYKELIRTDHHYTVWRSDTVNDLAMATQPIRISVITLAGCYCKYRTYRYVVTLGLSALSRHMVSVSRLS